MSPINSQPEEPTCSDTHSQSKCLLLVLSNTMKQKVHPGVSLCLWRHVHVGCDPEVASSNYCRPQAYLQAVRASAITRPKPTWEGLPGLFFSKMWQTIQTKGEKQCNYCVIYNTHNLLIHCLTAVIVQSLRSSNETVSWIIEYSWELHMLTNFLKVHFQSVAECTDFKKKTESWMLFPVYHFESVMYVGVTWECIWKLVIRHLFSHFPSSSGICECKSGVYGPKCDECHPGFFYFSSSGCRPCQCHNHTSYCHPQSGKSLTMLLASNMLTYESILFSGTGTKEQ